MAHPSTTDSGGQTTQITAGFNNIVISWTRTLKIIRNDTLHGFLPFSGFQLWGWVPRDEEECSHWVHVTQGCKGDHRVQYTSHVQPLPPRQTQPLLHCLQHSICCRTSLLVSAVHATAKKWSLRVQRKLSQWCTAILLVARDLVERKAAW